jgi:hypothetical protein
MKVYRLEKKGIGPYMGRSQRIMYVSGKKWKRTEHVRNQHPMKKDWTGTHYQAVRNKDYLFGTSSKELLKAYFGYSLAPLFKQGYKIKVYEVPAHEVLDMGQEVAFPVQYHKLKTVKRVKRNTKLVTQTA